MNMPLTGVSKKVLPRLVGLPVFLGALALALPAIRVISYATQITSFPNGTPPNGFYVVVRPLAQAHGANTLAAVRWESLPPGTPGSDFTFLLAQATGSVPGTADVMAYEVIV